MSVYQRYMGAFVQGALATGFTVGGNPISVTAGTYYLSGITGETQLLEHLQANIRAWGAPYGSATVTLSSTGYVTIGDLGGVTAIVWVDTDLRDLLGFTGDLSGQPNYTAPNQARYVWCPSRPLAEYPGDIDSWWLPRSTSFPYRSPDGSTYTVKGSTINDGVFRYKHLPKENVITSSTTVWESYQRFWTDVFHAGQPARVFIDRTAEAYKTGIIGTNSDEPIGSFGDMISRDVRTYNGLWEVELRLWEYV